MRDAVIVEHKTSGEDIGLGSTYWRRLTLDSQISNYIIGAQALGYAPRGVLYDVARKPALRPYQATPEESRKYKKDGTLYANQREHDETPEEYYGRVLADIAEKPDVYFQRGTVVRLADEVAAAAEDAWTLAKWIREVQLEADGRGEAAWPRNVDACYTYGRACDYWDVCSGTASIGDDTRYETTDAHTELSASSGDDGKRRLPMVSTSSLKTFRSCPRRYYYRYEMRRRPPARSAALRFGTAWHAGLEVWWATRDLDRALEAMESHDDASPDPYDIARARALMVGYDARWSGEPHTVLAVEAEFRAPLVNPRTGQASRTWELGGKIDAVIAA